MSAAGGSPPASDDRVLRAALDGAAGLGLDDAEFALFDADATRVSVSGGVVEALERRRERGLGVRVWAGGRTGFTFTSDLSPAALARALEAARDLARLAEPDDARRAPEPAAGRTIPLRGRPAPTGGAEPRPHVLSRSPNEDVGLAAVPLARRVALAHEVERAARAVSPEVDRVRSAQYRDARETLRVLSTRGVDASATASRAWLSIEAAARRGGDQRLGAYADWALGPGGLDPARVGRVGAERARAMLGARPGRTGRVPVVLEPQATGALLDALAPLLSALRALRGRTILAGREATRVGAPGLTLVDDATLPGTWGTAPFDGEGQPTARRVLVEEGVLRGFLHDAYTARRTGQPTTGHARRTGYTAPPSIGPHNLHLLPTGETRPELLARAEGGLYVTDLLGLHTVNATTGDVSLGASGRAIDPGGALGAPLDRLAISGTLDLLFAAVEAVADDLEWLPGGPGGCTVLFGELPVSGS